MDTIKSIADPGSPTPALDEHSFSEGSCLGEIREAVDTSRALLSDGYVILRGLYSDSVIAEARRLVIDNIDLFKNTRPNPASGHLAGFHRYPVLEPLHILIANNQGLLEIVATASGGSLVRSIGLSDITVNRSQEWHVDLLRGRYRHHLNPDICWGVEGGGLYKALLYLQPSDSLKIMPGAHQVPTPLDDDRKSRPGSSTVVRSVRVETGDVILMDIRLPHRGSSEQELAGKACLETPKILISTVLGGARKPLTKAMEAGNFERLRDWDALYEDQDIRPALS